MMKRLTPNKSPNDAKSYLALELQNGLKILIVSDPECDKAAASLSVGAGSMNDPDDIPGLAHLCEHLLSLEVNGEPSGTKPFNSFIAEHGGMFNAFTARDQTNFHFDVDPTAFFVALFRFSRFFTGINTLTENDVEREIGIVHAEHESKINRDSWRKMAVEASTSKKGHPFQKFSTGNKSTLLDIPKEKGINVLKAAQEFKLKYYVANIMALVVYGRDSLPKLEETCVQLFSKVNDNKNLGLPCWDEWPYGCNELRKRIDIVSLADIRDFFLVFPIANMRPFYKTFPHGYLTRIIGNRGPGSLYSYLSDMQWVETSYMNASVPARGFGELSVGFQLTKAGLEHINEIIHLSFQYIKMVKEKGPQESFWKEMQEVMYLKFLYQDKEIPVDFAQRMSNLLHVYPMEDILTVGSIITEYDVALIQKYMDYLDPENCRVITVCKANALMELNFSHDQWYGVQFVETEFTDEQISTWKFCDVPDFFYLPLKNKYIPTNFILKHDKKEMKQLYWSPILIEDSPLCKAWFLPDHEFQLAKGVIRLDMRSPLSVVDPISYNLNQIWFLTLKNMLSDQFYQATVACAFHGVKATLHGAEISVSGFSDNLLVLIEEMLKAVLESVHLSNKFAKHFSTARGRYITNLVNLKNLPPANLTNHYLSLLLRDKRFSYEELQDAIPDTTEENLIRYMNGFFFRTYFEWMVYGNFTQEEAKNLIQSGSEIISEKFKTRALLPSQKVKPREICLSPGIQFIFQSKIPSSAGNSCGILIQLGILKMRDSLVAEIIDQIIFEPLFTQLRNKHQMGYIVRSSVRKSNGCQGLLIFLQGDKEPAEMSERTFEVLRMIEERLVNMSPAEFAQHKKAVRVRKSERPKSMLMLFNKLWNNEIISRRYDFESVENELKMLESISKTEVLQFYKVHVSNTSESRKVLQIQLLSSLDQHQNECINNSPLLQPCGKELQAQLEDLFLVEKSQKIKTFTIRDISEWKLKMSLYPSRPF